VSGFVDLRLNQGGVQAEESFWPSFTDIMAVVVMIFLITTSVLILRNWELIQQISRTAQAEQRAEMALAKIKETATAEEQLANAKHHITVLRLELLRSERERQRRQKELAKEREQSVQLTASLSGLEQRLVEETHSKEKIDAELQQLAAAQTVLRVQLEQETRSKETLSESLQRLATQLSELQSLYEANRAQLAQSQAELGSERDRYAQLRTQSETTSSELSALRADYSTQEAQIAELQESATQVEARYVSLVGDYGELKVKYNKLIKPARSARGKYVVEVRYTRTEGQYQLSMREPNDEDFRSLDLAELHQTLASLRDRLPEQLYIRVIFPEESGLSYKEAWEFTQDMLSKYDYYHRER
jgi:myosin heavy subunit